MTQPPSGAPAATRGRRDAAWLAAGSSLAGVLAYVFFALVIRALGAGPAAPVAVLWAWWGFAGAALTFPVQHWIARTAATSAGEASVRRGLAHVAWAVLGVSILAGALGWLARERLFGPDGAWFPLLVVMVGLGSGLLGLMRGLQSARHRFVAVGAGLVAENGIRCLVAVGLVLAGSDTPVFYGLALLAGYAVVALWPRALVPRGSGHGGGAGPLLFVSGASAGQLLAQVTLTGGPVLVAAIGGAPFEVTALFAGLALFRAPYTLALGVVAAVTGRLTALVERRRWATLARIRRLGGIALVATAAAGGLAGAWLGPPAMELVFGDGVRLEPGDSAVVAVGTVIAMANLVLTLGLLARNRSGGVVAAWLVAAPFGAAGHLLLGDSALSSTCWTFLVTEVAAFAALAGWESRSDRLVGREEHRGAERQVATGEDAGLDS
jgi:O-antigen/teichoic acid export membrane protein